MELLLVCDPARLSKAHEVLHWHARSHATLNGWMKWRAARILAKACDGSCQQFHYVPLFINLQNTMISESCITWGLGHPWFRDSRALQLFGSTASNVFQPQRQVPHTIPFTISPCDCAPKTHTAALTLGKSINILYLLKRYILQNRESEVMQQSSPWKALGIIWSPHDLIHRNWGLTRNIKEASQHDRMLQSRMASFHFIQYFKNTAILFTYDIYATHTCSLAYCVHIYIYHVLTFQEVQHLQLPFCLLILLADHSSASLVPGFFSMA